MAGATNLSNLDYIIIPGGPTDYMVTQNVLTDLVKINSDLSIGPDLAMAWDVSPDATSFTFHLRSDVQFHDGTPFNAAAASLMVRSLGRPAIEGAAEAPVGWELSRQHFAEDRLY